MDAKIGFHISIAGSISNSVANALKIGYSVFQIFSWNPNRLTAKPIDIDDAKFFQIKLKDFVIISSVIVHMPYLPNPSAPYEVLYKKSIIFSQNEIIFNWCSPKIGLN